MKDLDDSREIRATLNGSHGYSWLICTAFLLLSVGLFILGLTYFFQYATHGQGRNAYESDCNGISLDSPQTNPAGTCYSVIATVRIASDINRGHVIDTNVQPTLPDGEMMKEYTLDDVIMVHDTVGKFPIQVWRGQLAAIRIGNETVLTRDCPASIRQDLFLWGVVLVFISLVSGIVCGYIWYSLKNA